MRTDLLDLVPKEHRKSFQEGWKSSPFLVDPVLELLNKRLKEIENRVFSIDDFTEETFAVRQALLVGKGNALREVIRMLEGLKNE